MPCYDPRDDEGNKLARQRLNEATKAACEMAKLIRRTGWLSFLSIETTQWIKEHDELDKQRVDEIYRTGG